MTPPTMRFVPAKAASAGAPAHNGSAAKGQKRQLPPSNEGSKLQRRAAPSDDDIAHPNLRPDSEEGQSSGSVSPTSPGRPSDARIVYRSFCPLPIKLLPGVRLEAEQNRPWLSVARSMLPNAGLGVFALRTFPVGAVLCQFEGSLLAGIKPKVLEDACEGTTQAAAGRYVLSLHNGGWVLDGGPVARAIRRGAEEVEMTVLTPGGDHTTERRTLEDVGVGCMVNHGTRDSANAKFILMKSDRSGLLPATAYLQATREIAAGEELLARYGNAESTAWG
ncbi:unnamed protein product [Effrenium voratum]|uniref:SET domain-containing protein n=1 Tax=Effrenium voratum TaxID=2562239 RepID=A0AA36IVG8_9DINO|nr:unnamed protein product [Effrenium voratum]CAJ1394259.1 unnamed protein product [Effrenium voratum]